VPPKVREFGYVPDLRGCISGDLILSFSIERGLIDRQIVSAQQRMGFGSDDARWTHAAVFLYEDWIVEALPFRGVVTGSLYNYFPDSVARIRRNPELSIEERCGLAVSAHRRLSLRYSLRAAIGAGLRAQIHKWGDAGGHADDSAIVCSQVFSDAHLEITLKWTDALVTPAALSATTDLVDIEIPWLKVPP
jgi:hypothetical protein